MSPQKIWLFLLGQVAVLALATLGLMVMLQPNLTPQTDPSTLLSTAAIGPLTLLFLAATASSLLGLCLKPYTKHETRLTHHVLLAATGLAAGLGLTIPWETTRVLASGHWGLSNMYEVSVLTLATLGILTLGFDKTHAPGKLLPFATPILAAAALFTYWLATIGAATPTELIPALQNTILPFHVMANFIGYGCFAVGAAAGAAMLVRHRADVRNRPSKLPPVEVLEKLAYNAIVVGFPVFSVAILLGCVWAYQAWGGYWSWDPKETWALIVWLVYAAYLHARTQVRPRPVILAWWLLLGFAATLFCYIGVNMVLSGLHSYGSLAT